MPYSSHSMRTYSTVSVFTRTRSTRVGMRAAPLRAKLMYIMEPPRCGDLEAVFMRSLSSRTVFYNTRTQDRGSTWSLCTISGIVSGACFLLSPQPSPQQIILPFLPTRQPQSSNAWLSAEQIVSYNLCGDTWHLKLSKSVKLG